MLIQGNPASEMSAAVVRLSSFITSHQASVHRVSPNLGGKPDNLESQQGSGWSGLSLGDVESNGKEKNQRCSFVGLWPEFYENWRI